MGKWLLLLALHVPVRNQYHPPPDPPPIFSGHCGTYTLYQIGDHVIIDSPLWCATGVIGHDGSIRVRWMSHEGDVAIGTYHLHGRDMLVGKWRYASGPTVWEDRIWRTKR